MMKKKEKVGNMVAGSKQPRKQRKRHFNAPKHARHRCMAVHLDEDLLLKYQIRSIPVRKGDTVKIMRGALKGHVDKVAKVNLKKGMVTVENATIAKADGTQLPKWIHPSNLLITKLDLTDLWRKNRLTELAESAVESEGEA
jgi:large subunit ribosomal protein L24